MKNGELIKILQKYSKEASITMDIMHCVNPAIFSIIYTEDAENPNDCYIEFVMSELAQG